MREYEKEPDLNDINHYPVDPDDIEAGMQQALVATVSRHPSRHTIALAPSSPSFDTPTQSEVSDNSHARNVIPLRANNHRSDDPTIC